MGSYSNWEYPSSADLQTFLLGRLKHIDRAKVVSVNALIDDARDTLPACRLTDEQMAKLFSETAMLLGLTPVFDPSLLDSRHSVYGYGHPAHRPDPDGTYAFKPGVRRVLPVRSDKRWHVTG
jgi:hypothetical protein